MNNKQPNPPRTASDQELERDARQQLDYLDRHKPRPQKLSAEEHKEIQRQIAYLDERKPRTNAEKPRTDSDYLYDPANVTVSQWQSVQRERHELEDRLARTLRQLGTTAEALQIAEDELDYLRQLCADVAATIEAGGDPSELTEDLWIAVNPKAGDERTREELLEEAVEIVRSWRVLKEYGTGNATAQRARRKAFDADCEASGFSPVEIMECAEKKLDWDNAARILGQQH